MSRELIDLKGLNCPLPVLRANKRIKELGDGAELEAHVTDPAAPDDFRQFCDSTGYAYLSCNKIDNYFAIIIRKQRKKGEEGKKMTNSIHNIFIIISIQKRINFI